MASSRNLKQLKSADRLERIQAVRKLGETKEVEAVDLLITALQDEDREVQEAAAYSLARIGDKRAIKPLAALLDDWFMAKVAAKALVHFGVAAVKPLSKALNSRMSSESDAVAQAVGVEALIAILVGSRSDMQEKVASSLGVVEDLSKVNPLVNALRKNRQAAAHALGDLGDRRAEKTLLILLDDKDEFVQSAAVIWLGRIRSQEAVEPLITLLLNGNDRLWEHAAIALGQIRDMRAVKPLIASLRRGGSRSIYEAILQFGEAAVDPLLIAIRDKNVLIRQASVELLGKLRVSRAAEALEATLRDKKPSIRQAAAEALELVGWQPRSNIQRAWLFVARLEWDETVSLAEDALKPLVFALRHTDDANNRLAIAQTLGKIGDARAIDPLLRVFQKDKNLFVQVSAAEALHSLGYQQADTSKPLVDALGASDAQKKQIAAEELGMMGDIRAVKPLIEQLESPYPQNRQKAAQILKETKDMRAVKPLLKVLKQDKDFFVREAAAQTLESLDSHALEGPQDEHSGKTSKRFPLDVLLVSGHMHAGASTSYGLHKYLSRHPAVRSYGIANEEEQAMSFVRDRLVNTIFIDPCFPGEMFGDSELFISQIRKEFPDIVFVLYTSADCLDSFCSIHPRYRHYFHLEHIWGFQEEGNQYPKAEVVDRILRRCEEWHLTRFEYDVGISFAGEDRKYAEDIADILQKEGARVFYDAYEEADLLGKNLFTHLHTVYSERCRFCVILISRAYASKVWTSHERIAAQERALQERDKEYIIPVRLDDTPLPGLSSTIAYINISKGMSQIANLISQKLWMSNKAIKHHIGRALY